MSFKRVRFQEPEDNIEKSTSFLKLKKRRTTQRTLLPGHEQGDDEFDDELTEGYRGMADVEDLLWDDEADQGPIKATNPERAAAKRAARRKDFAKLVRTEGGGLLDDVSAAEAEYEAHEGFWDNSGVPIEPFHLRQEREAGFFDDEGNYVAFKDNIEDAWLESLPKGPDLQEASKEYAGSMMARSSQEREQPGVLSNEALRCYKEGLIDLLRSGESVFDALRRLGNLQGSSRQVMRIAQRERIRKGRTVPSENRDAFDRLTEFSNILLGNGDYHVHTNHKEQLQHDLCTHASGIKAGMDPHADPASEHSWQKFAARLAVPSQPAVLSSEQAGSVNAAASIEQDGSGAAGPRPGLPVDPDEDIFANAEPTDKPDRGTQHSQSAAASPAFQLQDVSPEDAGTGEEQDDLADQGYRDSSPPYESDIDPMKLLEQQALAAAAAEPMQDIIMLGGSPEAGASLRPGTLQQELHAKSATGQQSLSAPTSGVPSGTHYESLQWEADAACDEQQDTGESGGGSDMEGFLYDQTSGFLYNSAMGAFYDMERKLFGDASSGQWYSLQNGIYHLMS